jgi:hypoxanthine phosphoribosyltransferase
LVEGPPTWHADAVPAHSAAELYPGDIKSVLLSEDEVQARVAELGTLVGENYRAAVADGQDLLLVTVSSASSRISIATSTTATC